MTKTKKEKAKWWLTIGAVVLSVVALVSAIIGLTKNITTTKLGSTDYAIGSVDSTGKVIDSKKSVYSKDLNTTDNLTIDIDEDTATIIYKVAYYDENEKFVSMTEAMSKDLDTTSIPSTAEYFRVIITPNQVDGEDVTLNIFNMSKYTSQIEVTFDK